MNLHRSIRYLPRQYRLPALAVVGAVAVIAMLYEPGGDPLAASAPAHAADGSLTAASVRVIDGDTIAMGSERIRFIGMDACEAGQVAQGPNGPWPCGQAATDRLIELIGSNPVTCLPERRDRYQRHVARCYAAGLDLGRQLVAEGLAVVYRYRGEATAPELVPVEAQARSAGLGLWATDFTDPSSHRRGN